MQFGTFPLAECEGAILAHSQRLPDVTLKKGALLSAYDLSRLAKAGITELIVAKLEKGDVLEDEAAKEIAKALQTTEVSISEAGTGRINFHAASSGVFTVSKELIDRINGVDPAITIATLSAFSPVREGRMVATIKIIPYAVSRTSLEVIKKIAAPSAAFSVKTFLPKKIGVISTVLPGLKDKVIAKTLDVLERRLDGTGSYIIAHSMCGHEAEAVTAEIEKLEGKCDLIILFGASAISDPQDVIPSALRLCGGRVLRLGMPVDPGNLLMLGELGNTPLLGAPGCARSPAENGFDFVLNRLLANIEVSSEDIAGMGVGGLLMEIGSRPQPRNVMKDNKPRVAAIILAGGQSRRMGAVNKLTAEISSKPLVQYPVLAAQKAGIKDILVVTGHYAEEIKSALDETGISFVHNPDYAEGLSTSLRTGISELNDQVTHVLVMLGDMPEITPEMIGNILNVAEKSSPDSIIVSTCLGKRGNPVLWPRAYFEQLCTISGDTGARHLIGENAASVVEVELGEAAALDLDTPDALSTYLASRKD